VGIGAGDGDFRVGLVNCRGESRARDADRDAVSGENDRASDGKRDSSGDGGSGRRARRSRARAVDERDLGFARRRRALGTGRRRGRAAARRATTKEVSSEG
jgi:hypothetical protein